MQQVVNLRYRPEHRLQRLIEAGHPL